MHGPAHVCNSSQAQIEHVSICAKFFMQDSTAACWTGDPFTLHAESCIHSHAVSLCIATTQCIMSILLTVASSL